MISWQVGLSDGTTHYEGKGLFSLITGENSPWLKLQKHLKEHALSITSLSLVFGSRRFNLPSSGNNPKFRMAYIAEKPIGYNFFRIYGVDSVGQTNGCTVIEAIYQSYKLQVWVDNSNPNVSWSMTVRVE